MSGIVTVVVGCRPATPDYMAEYFLLHVHAEDGPAWIDPVTFGLSDAAWARDWIRDLGLLDALFGGFDDIPPQLLDAGKFLVRGRMILTSYGCPIDGGPWDEPEFELIDWRRLPGEFNPDHYQKCQSWEVGE